MLFYKVKKAGLRANEPAIEGQAIGKRRHEVKLAHGFRKFFDTTATNGGVNPLYVELLQGHRIGMKQHYYKPTPDQLLEGTGQLRGYLAAVDDLTFSDEFRLTKENRELKDKLNDNEFLRQKVANLEKQFKDFIQTGRAEVDLDTLAKLVEDEGA